MYSYIAMNSVANVYRHLKNNSFPELTQPFAILKLAPLTSELHAIYESKVAIHNQNVTQNMFADSGFDIFVPENVEFNVLVKTHFIDHKIKAEMIYCDVDTDTLIPCAYAIHPRSSISKTPLMLANHTGIIDAGYRGSVIGAFRCLESTPYLVESNTRLLQICHPTLCPIYVVLCNENDLSSSERGGNGFGSTGK